MCVCVCVCVCLCVRVCVCACVCVCVCLFFEPALRICKRNRQLHDAKINYSEKRSFNSSAQTNKTVVKRTSALFLKGDCFAVEMNRVNVPLKAIYRRSSRPVRPVKAGDDQSIKNH